MSMETLKLAINVIEKLSYEYGRLLDDDCDYGVSPSELNPDIIQAYHVKRLLQQLIDNYELQSFPMRKSND